MSVYHRSRYAAPPARSELMMQTTYSRTSCITETDTEGRGSRGTRRGPWGSQRSWRRGWGLEELGEDLEGLEEVGDSAKVSGKSATNSRNPKKNLKKNLKKNSTRNTKRKSRRNTKMPATLGEPLLFLFQPRHDPNILCKRILLRHRQEITIWVFELCHNFIFLVWS